MYLACWLPQRKQLSSINVELSFNKIFCVEGSFGMECNSFNIFVFDDENKHF